jgi:acylphosphatase
MKQVTAKRARFVVRGLVQGVNFRAAVVREASLRGITGRVWNREDGAVELVAEGEAPAVADLARWLREGSRLAEVTGVEQSDLAGERNYREFSITYGPTS